MPLLGKIRKLNARQLFMLTKIFLGKPQYLFPTYKATRRTIQIANRLYGKAHHKDNVTNAFRHALWNFLIAKNCFAQNNSVEKSVAWAKTITNLHEKLMPNKPLPKTMDLHNNFVGRKVFKKHYMLEADEKIIKCFTELIPQAQKVGNVKDIIKDSLQLVYIEDYENER